MQIGGQAWDGNGNPGRGERSKEAGARGRDWQNFLSQEKESAFAFHQAAPDLGWRRRSGGFWD